MNPPALDPFHDPALQPDDLLARLAWLRDIIAPRLERFLGYYRNPTTDLAHALPCPAGTGFSVRPFRQYQELGLPTRLTGFRRAADGAATPAGSPETLRKEIVIENDIAWRIDTLVDFAVGRAPAITSTARDAATRERLTPVINSLLQLGDRASNRGLGLLQELVLHGAICGSAWIHLRPTAELLARLAHQAHAHDELQAHHPHAESGQTNAAPLPDSASTAGGGTVEAAFLPALDASRWLAIEVIEAARLCPLPHAGHGDPLTPHAAALLREPAAPAPLPTQPLGGFWQRMRTWLSRPPIGLAIGDLSFDLFNPVHWQRYERGVLVEEGDNPLGLVPWVRFANARDPAAATRVGPAGSTILDTGIGEVEPLIGLQDELNTRLSDRASRVTMSCFRMYLARGIDEFIKRPVGPGQMWATDNPDASIESFGGDAAMPSEDAHISEIRDALDKISGVSPVAAGLIRGKLGNLTSAVALRLTLIALLARTERRRASLNQTLAAVVRMGLQILDRAGIVHSNSDDRGIDVNWPTALPESDIDRLKEAQAKLAIGVPRAVVLSELGYSELNPA